MAFAWWSGLLSKQNYTHSRLPSSLKVRFMLQDSSTGPYKLREKATGYDKSHSRTDITRHAQINNTYTNTMNNEAPKVQMPGWSATIYTKLSTIPQTQQLQAAIKISQSMPALVMQSEANRCWPHAGVIINLGVPSNVSTWVRLVIACSFLAQFVRTRAAIL